MPVPSPELSPAAETVSPQAATDVVQHCGGHPSDTAAPEQPESESFDSDSDPQAGPRPFHPQPLSRHHVATHTALPDVS